MKLLRRIRIVLTDQSGGISPLLAGIVLLVIFLSGAVYEFLTCFLIAQGVRDAMQNAANNVSTKNYYNAYASERSGCTGAYYLDYDDSWSDNSDDGDIGNSINGTLGLTDDDGELVKWASGNQQYSISDLSVFLKNPPLKSNNSDFGISVTYTLKLDVVVFGISTQIQVPQSVKAGFTRKF